MCTSTRTGPGWRLANEGEKLVKSMAKAHVDAIDSRGIGKYWGVQNSWRPGASDPGDMKQSSCVEWALEVTGAAFRAVGRGSVWSRIYSTTVANGAKGTVLAKQLILFDSWTGIYWNPDSAKAADGSDEHPYSAHIAKKKGTYYGIPVKDQILNYNPAYGSSTTDDNSGIDKLKKVPYWVGCARGGSHVFCGTRGHVSEFHWDAHPTDRNAIELVELETYAWLSGIIVVPQGVWESV